MISFQNALRDEFVEKSIQLNKFKKDSIKNSKEFILWADIKIKELHEWLKNYEFVQESEEIEFFKDIKPCIISRLILHKEIFRVATTIPSGNKLCLKFYKEEQKKVAVNLSIDPRFYSYYRSQANDLDSMYFTRKTTKSFFETDCSQIGFDSQISTCYETKIAAILAYDQLSSYFERQIKRTENKIKAKKKTKRKELFRKSKLHWTRKKSEFTELIYLIHFSKMINHGNSSLKEIAIELGKAFNMDIKETLYGTFNEIKKRKNPNSKFIQSLEDTYQLIMESEYN